MALLDQISTVLEANGACYNVTDEQLLDDIRKHSIGQEGMSVVVNWC